MNNLSQVTGVILAGGLARRMNHQDKGLIPYQGRPMISYVIAAMSPVVDQLIINANRNIEHYQQWGWPVLTDSTASFDGPLAGILTAMRHSQTNVLLVAPCDCPLITSKHLQQLLNTRQQHAADIAVAFDGERLHPVFLALKTSLRTELQDYLASGQRKVETWLTRYHTVKTDFSDQQALFTNINTMTELSTLESQTLKTR